MVRKVNRSTPSASRRPLVPLKPSLSLKLLASAIALSPCLFQHSAQELLYPLFSSAPTHALETIIPFYSLIFATVVIQKVSFKVKPSWRTCWLVSGIWKILSEGLTRWYGEELLGFGLTKGVLVGRLLLEAIPLLAMANWVWGQVECKERMAFLPNWFIPFAFAVLRLIPTPSFITPSFASVPTCYVLQIQGLFLVFVSLFATHPALQKVPRSQHRPHQHSRFSNSLFVRLSFFALVLALAHKVAQSSTHCPTSSHLLPPPAASSRILASTKSLTGIIVVGEQQVPGPNGEDGYRFRYLRADHSLLGGLWTGVSEMELKRMRSTVTEEEVVKRAESIYSTFILQELVRLVETPEDLPRQSPEQGLVIGLGAGLIARALDQHRVNLTICEIDPVVYHYGREYFGVPEPAEVVLQDAATWLDKRDSSEKVFDYIVHDVFTGGQVPSSLFTIEFWSTIRQSLHRSGVLAVNFAGALASPASKLVLSTLLHSFPHCRAFEDNPSSVSNDTIGDDHMLKNLVIFCTPSWFLPVVFREPTPSDFLPYPSPQIRKKVFQDYPSQEISLERFKLAREGEEGGDSDWAKEQREKWILTKKNSNKLEKEQYEGTKDHWKAMEKVLPKETWASW